MERRLRSPIDVGRRRVPGLLTRDVEGPKVSHGCSPTAPSKGETFSNRQAGLTEHTWKI